LFKFLQSAGQVAEAGGQNAPRVVRRPRVEKASIDLDGFFECLDTLFGFSRPTKIVEAYGQIGQTGHRTDGGQSAIELEDLDVDSQEVLARGSPKMNCSKSYRNAMPSQNWYCRAIKAAGCRQKKHAWKTGRAWIESKNWESVFVANSI
jgi:hypothetical protein